MKYLKVKWLHDSNDYPIEMYSELDSKRNEIRKVEIFPDDSIGYAENASSFGKTILGKVPIPSIQEINEDPQFIAMEITKDSFDNIWNKFYMNL